MYHTDIAIVEANTLAALGLRTIFEEMIPDVAVRVFADFGALIDDTPDVYAHYFVSAQIYFEHTAFFIEKAPRAIVLCNGNQKLPAGVPALNVCLSQKDLIKAIMNMRSRGHHSSSVRHGMEGTGEHELSPREIEVLQLLTRGLINKEIADKLNISLTTVISHRKNITAKLGIRSVSGLTIYAVMHGYIEADSI